MSTSDVYATGFDEARGRTNDATECPECAGQLRTDGGETSCGDCGLVVDEYRIDHGFERRVEAESERTGAPLTPARHDRGLSSEIGRWVDGKGNRLTQQKRRHMGRLRVQHNRGRWRSKSERNLADGFREIGRITGALDVPRTVRDRACALFRRAQRENLLLGRSIEAMAAGCVYAACRSAGCLRTIDELHGVSPCSRSNLQTAYRVVNVELGVETPPPRLGDHVSRLVSTCGVPGGVRERAEELARIADAAGLANGRNPAGIAAACLYAAGRERGAGLTQAELAEAAGVTATTIRARCAELEGGFGAQS